MTDSQDLILIPNIVSHFSVLTRALHRLNLIVLLTGGILDVYPISLLLFSQPTIVFDGHGWFYVQNFNPGFEVASKTVLIKTF